MGKTSFSGPVFGAKSLLWTASLKDAAASTGATVIASINVPAGQDWYVCDIAAYRGSTASTGFVLRVTDDSSVVGSVAITSSLASQTNSTSLTPSAGEFEGVRCAAGSSMTMDFNQSGSSVAASTAVTGWVYGYIRYIDSSRTLNS